MNLLSTKDSAHLLGVDRATVLRYSYNGRLTNLGTKRRPLFHPRELNRVREQREADRLAGLRALTQSLDTCTLRIATSGNAP